MPRRTEPIGIAAVACRLHRGVLREEDEGASARAGGQGESRGSLDHGLGVGTVLGIEGDAQAHAEPKGGLSGEGRKVESGEEALDPARRFESGRPVLARIQHRELVSHVADRRAFLPHRALEGARHQDEDRVAGLVPEAVVDLLEVVGLEHDERHRRP